ncbi:hypothetical protein CspHIS471_0302680 [Cutaneotrichosporon sp. HIS471]|nr:hypothetical protein CspHIS471_0302680 [Cutaneotrichosporon sp. HIS471]
MDAIFASAPPQTLVVLRATCRTYHTRANTILGRHLALSDTELRSALGPRVPLHLNHNSPQVLDCFAHYALQPAVHVYHAAGTPILRMRDGPLAVIDIIAPSTVIVFGWQRIEPEKRWVILGGAPRRASPVEHCSTVRKVVVVIDGVPDYTCYAQGMVGAWPSIRDITVIYVPKSPVQKVGKAVSLDDKIGSILYEMRARIELIEQKDSDLRLTLVNADSMPSNAFPCNGRVSGWAYLIHRTGSRTSRGKEGMRDWDGRFKCPTLRHYVQVARDAHGPVVDDAIRFLSLDEYETELGSEAFALETDPTFVL